MSVSQWLSFYQRQAGFLVTGVDIDENKINQLKNNKSYIHEVDLEELMSKQLNKDLNVTTSIPDDGDVYIISVGTPVEKNKKEICHLT